MAYIDVFHAWRGVSELRYRAIVACAKYATYLHGTGTPAQRAWAAAILPGAGVEIEADAVAWPLAFDPAVVEHGEAITDEQLQAAVETALNTYRVPA